MSLPAIDRGTTVLSAESIVGRYFAEVVDGRSESSIDELFAIDCRIIRADRRTPIVGREALHRFVRLSISAVPEIHTTVLSVITNGAGDVAALVRHEVRFGPLLLTPLGPCLSAGRSATWEAIALFRIVDGLIAEERVIRDEITILRQLGLLPAARRRALRATLSQWLRRAFAGIPRRNRAENARE
jgi:hypothetical protein